MTSIDKFSIDNFITAARELDYLDLILHCQKELKWLDGIKITKTSPYKDSEWSIKEYRDFIHQFSYTLNTGNKPATMKAEQFQRTKPIIEALVLKGQWKNEGLIIYE